MPVKWMLASIVSPISFSFSGATDCNSWIEENGLALRFQSCSPSTAMHGENVSELHTSPTWKRPLICEAAYGLLGSSLCSLEPARIEHLRACFFMRYSRHVALHPSASDSIKRSIDNRLINKILRIVPRVSGSRFTMAFTSRRLTNWIITDRPTPA
jgi:hypothetical protein